jgi:hypothetical protein
MATYKSIVGQKINKVSSDPSEATTGQMWYNSTTQSLRGLAVVEAFVSQTNLPTKTAYNTSFGQAVPTTVSAGGMAGPGPAPTAAVFEFNGLGWASGGTLPSTGKESARGFGTLTAGAIAGGSPGASPAGSTDTSEYDGSSWTSGGALPTSVQAAHTWGTQTAGFLTGGRGNGPPFPKESASYTYNGTSWTGSTAMPAGRQFGGSSSSSPQTSALVFNGQNPSNTNDTIEWDGSSWATAPNVTFTATQIASGGTATAALSAGGDTPPGGMGTASSKYDGTSWATGASLSTGRRATTGQGATGTTSMVIGGDTNSGSPPQYSTAVEEYNLSTNAITSGAWASGGALPTAVYDNAGAGTQTAGLSFGGDTAPDGKTTATFEYDGSSWSSGGALGTGRRELGGFGTQTAAVACCGGNYPASTLSEEYNGSSWTAGNATSVARTMMGAAGVLTSGLVCGGNPGTITTTEEYDGTNWGSGGALPVGKQSNDSFGNIVTAIRNVGGNTSPANYVSTSESYDGTNWTSGPTMTYGADRLSATGSSTSGLVFSGRVSGTATTSSQYFNGTSFATSPSLGTARNGGAAAGKGETSNATSFVAGGYPGRLTATEEFTGETISANVETFSTS